MTLSISGDQFILEGKPFRILSGAMHYFRVPREYWHDRLGKMRLMGLNTIETYVAWNLHEPKPGEFHFEGNLDIEAFIRAAAEHGLKVILRPGPYICSEWDFGGLPAWLLKDPQMQVRCSYPPFIAAMDRFFDVLLKPLLSLQFSQGGPIIMVQVENEYGSYGDDKAYLAHIRDTLRRIGVVEFLFTSDGEQGRNLNAGMLDGTFATVNFDHAPEHAFKLLRELQPDGPLMCSEFWDGWFDHWKLWHETRPAFRVAAIFERMLKAGASVNLYMWHGGTNFGFMNGANYVFGKYLSIVNTYDYDAPLSEAGDITPKYHRLRQVISKFAPVPDEPLPANAPKLQIEQVEVTSAVSLWKSLPKLSSPVRLPNPEPMEYLDQNYGFILYRIRLSGPQSGSMSIKGLRDRAQVFVDGKPVGVLRRNRPNQSLRIAVPQAGAQLDILVENMGRVNFGPELMDRKGILGGVILNGHYVFDWEVFCLPLDDLSALEFANTENVMNEPAFYRAAFMVDQPLDTFLKLPGWEKGVAWVNGFNLGRYWKVGPQQALYVPATVLKPGKNELTLFELHGTRKMQARFTAKP
ncbi:MAG: beta-galactosidase [Chloroflexi bacterium HGW-Chloroflexi-4]|jgi:beta-galactosidase|nr:MAG: beta-galactosidase [Chloroflexi bacterium HGW-Chloroflexi-4]